EFEELSLAIPFQASAALAWPLVSLPIHFRKGLGSPPPRRFNNFSSLPENRLGRSFRPNKLRIGVEITCRVCHLSLRERSAFRGAKGDTFLPVRAPKTSSEE